MKQSKQLTFIDLFAGVGGFRMGMEKAGHKCVGFCEIDKYARQSYKAIFNTENEVEMHDITRISDDTIRGFGRVDIITGGFPCQAFSSAGKRRGFADTRGTLFFEIARFAHILRPSILFLENVKGLLNHNEGATFETILRTLDELGYDVAWQLLNSKDFVPQNRERVFVVGCFRGSGARKFLPLTGEEKSVDQESAKINIAGTTNKRNNLNTNLRERTYYTDGLMGTLTATDYKTPKQIVVGNVNPSGQGMNGQVCSIEGIAPTLTTNKGEGNKVAIPVISPDKEEVRQNGRRIKNNGEEMFTLTAQDRHGIIVEGKIDGRYRSAVSVYSPDGLCPTLNTMQGGGQQPKIVVNEIPKNTIDIANEDRNDLAQRDFQVRKLTPLECWRLQSFPDWAFLAAKFGSKQVAQRILAENLDHYNCPFEQKVSDSQLYKQAGNSVTVDVIYFIAKHFHLS
ncbi:DNA cytosine methyltransferase [Enterococcus sp. AZ012]|uniref:DNA cytosine methyltransferase n=1 Tax=unclassified Enterococcus TaxID=2608891 RepID=UPI003D2C3F4A